MPYSTFLRISPLPASQLTPEEVIMTPLGGAVQEGQTQAVMEGDGSLCLE